MMKTKFIILRRHENIKIIHLTPEEQEEYKKYNDTSEFLKTLEGRYDFRLGDWEWMITDNKPNLKYYDGGVESYISGRICWTEMRGINYRGEDYQIETKLYSHLDSEEAYTTTESDQEWWIDLRTQYSQRHPENLQKFIESFPEKNIEKIPGDMWKARLEGDYEFSTIGKTREEAIKNLYLWTNVD